MKNISKLSDEQVVKLVREKDKELYAEIIRRYQGKLMRYAVYLIQDYHQASDVVQGAFIKAYTNLYGFKINKKFSSWIYRIVHNEAMNLVKKHSKESAFPEDFQIEDKTNLEDEIIRKEVESLAADCLGEMPVEYREPLALYFLEDKSYEEISDILRIPVGTVGTRIFRAKLLMKKLCQKKK